MNTIKCECGECKVCKKREASKRYYLKSGKERQKEYVKKNKEKNKEWMKNWRLRNPEKFKENKKKSMFKKKQKYADMTKEWRKKNKQKTKQFAHNYRLNLVDTYVKTLIVKATNIKYKSLDKHSELIKSYREQIKIKRLIKQKKEELCQN